MIVVLKAIAAGALGIGVFLLAVMVILLALLWAAPRHRNDQG